MRYTSTVEQTVSHTMGFGSKGAVFNTHKIWRATIRCEGRDPERVTTEDYRTKAEAQKWADAAVKEYSAFFKDRGFHRDLNWQLRRGKETVGYFKGFQTLSKAAYQLDRPEHAKQHLWVRKTSKPGRYGQSPISADLQFYDANGEPIREENGINYRVRSTK